MTKLYDLARMTTATTGTGTITLGSAVAPLLTFDQAGVQNGDVVTYSIVDGTVGCEIGRGTYTSSGTTLSRDTVLKSSNSGSKISLSGSAQVVITPSAEDLVDASIITTGTLSAANGGTGISNNAANTLTFTGAYSLGLTLSENSSLTLPSSGTLATTAQIPSVPTGANPTGTIGLTAVNGSGATFLRSDGAPALSQAIAPTWTSKHIWSNSSINISGSIPDTYTFTGSGSSALIMQNVSGAAASGTVPEIAGQFTLTSNVGTGDAGAYKIGLTSSVIGGANSASVYGFNAITQGYAGTSGYLVTGIESDINNVGADATVLGAATASYGCVCVGAGSYKNTAAYWATSLTGAEWQYAFACSPTSGNGATLATFFDHCAAENVLLSDTSHVLGINLFSTTITGGLGCAFISPNNVGFGSANAAGNATIPLVYLDGSNKENYGSQSVTQHVFNVNPGAAGAAVNIINSHATSGDAGLTLQVGSDVNTDVSTMVYFTTYNAGHVVGTITRNTGAFTVTYGTSSDARLKDQISDYIDGLSTVLSMRPRTYTWKDGDGSQAIGFIAQELYENYPSAVTIGGDNAHTNPWQIDYGRITPALVSAIQQLSREIDIIYRNLGLTRKYHDDTEH